MSLRPRTPLCIDGPGWDRRPLSRATETSEPVRFGADGLPGIDPVVLLTGGMQARSPRISSYGSHRLWRAVRQRVQVTARGFPP
jgi:hypothetical protein